MQWVCGENGGSGLGEGLLPRRSQWLERRRRQNLYRRLGGRTLPRWGGRWGCCFEVRGRRSGGEVVAKVVEVVCGFGMVFLGEGR